MKIARERARDSSIEGIWSSVTELQFDGGDLTRIHNLRFITSGNFIRTSSGKVYRRLFCKFFLVQVLKFDKSWTLSVHFRRDRCREVGLSVGRRKGEVRQGTFRRRQMTGDEISCYAILFHSTFLPYDKQPFVCPHLISAFDVFDIWLCSMVVFNRCVQSVCSMVDAKLALRVWLVNGSIVLPFIRDLSYRFTSQTTCFVSDSLSLSFDSLQE